MPRIPLIAAAGLVMVANGIALGLAAYNRSGSPAATIVLTERELGLPPADPDNSGLWLEVRWQSPDDGLAVGLADRSDARDRAALESLGFDCSQPLDDPAARRHYRQMLARRGFVVFELGGERWRAHAEAVARGDEDPPWTRQNDTARSGGPATDAAERWRRERLTGSRLLPVDAGPDPNALRRRYADQARYLIVPGIVRPGIVDPTPAAPGRLALQVNQVWPAVIHVPPAHRDLFDTLSRERPGEDDRWNEAGRAPRYEVTVHYGRRGEPWIGGVGRLPAAGDSSDPGPKSSHAH